ncbi:MAG: GNAT family N-acetyltransferase [Deltaproteobacteria bacterium]|nr:GNAT family N-acetyltransferase [Deltaproteobacteria bacterium]
MNDERRAPPIRVRVTGLQEAQLPELAAIERRVAEAQATAGSATPLDERGILGLLRLHDVRVLEADHDPAGYLAWRDEAPGIAVLERVTIEPTLRWFGLGTRLLREVGEKATSHGIPLAACVVPERDQAAAAFLAKRGFGRASDDPTKLPEALVAWRAEQPALVGAEGVVLWWGRTDGLGTIPGLPPPVPVW